MICATVRIRCAGCSPIISESRVPVRVIYGVRFHRLRVGKKSTIASSMKQLQVILIRFSSYSYAQIIFVCLLPNMLTAKPLFLTHHLFLVSEVAFRSNVLEFRDLSDKGSEPSVVG